MLHGVVYAPIDGCSTRTSQAVVDAEIRLICPDFQERSAEPNPLRSGDYGEFAFAMVSFDAFSDHCRVRVTKPGYQPFEASLAELHYRVEPEARRVRIDIPLRRGPSP